MSGPNDTLELESSEIVRDGLNLKLVSLEVTNNLTPRPAPAVTLGKVEVTGTFTTYFENPTVLAAFFGRPHKAAVWEKVRPTLIRALLYAALALAGSLLFISGAL